MAEITPKNPVFAKPPITEVAIGVVFQPVAKLQSVHLGAWWQQIREPYGMVEEHPPLPPQMDQFPGDLPFPAGPQIVFGTFPRYWFHDDEKRRILQVQQDRFVTNWRRISEADVYPEYNKSLRPEFESRWNQFCGFLQEQKLGEPKIALCEVSYVNTLLPGIGPETLSNLPSVVAPWSGKFTEEVPPLEGVVIHAGFLIPNMKGRVQMLLQPVRDAATGVGAVQLTVFSRIRPGPQTAPADVLQWLDLAHRWAVHAFAAFTTKDIQKSWDQTR